MARGKAPTFEQQRNAIMDAAAEWFARKGFHNATTAEIARACGVSKPLLYHYYRDKEHLLFDIADSYIDRLLGVVAEVEARRKEPEAHFAALVEGFLKTYASAQYYHVVLVQDVKFLQAEQAERIRGKQRRVVAAVAVALRRLEPGLQPKGLETPVTMILFGMINWLYTWVHPDGPLRIEDLAPVVTRLFLDGVHGIAARPRALAATAVG